MVSIRCKMIVKSVLENLSLPYVTVELGEVEIKAKIQKQKYEMLKKELTEFGLELIES